MSSSKKNTSLLIGIIGILLILLAGSIGYIVASANNSSSRENLEIRKDIDNLKEAYDIRIADKTSNFYNLQIQKDSIKKLVDALEQSKQNEQTLLKYKEQYQNLESKMKVLVDEIITLNGKKIQITSVEKNKQSNSNFEEKFKDKIKISNKPETNNKTKPKTNLVVTVKDTPKETDNKTNVSSSAKIVVSKKEPTESLSEKKIEKSNKVSISNATVQAFISKSAATKIATTNAKKADFIKIDFTINSNSDFEGFEKTYYFQIINPKNTIVGQRKTEYFDGQLLTYSFSKSFFYNGQVLNISQEYLLNDLEKGYYFINIFDKNNLVGKTTLQLN